MSDLFEPKLPPINLYAMAPAWIFQGKLAMAGIKRTKHDDVFSKLVRERVNFTCECCGKDYRDRPQGLHCSHIMSRRSKSTRWHPDNAFAHCYSCHQHLGGNPLLFAEFAKDEMGEEKLDRIVFKSRQAMKLKAWDLEELYQHMKEQYALMLEQRRVGFTGRVEFTVPEWYE